MANEVVCRKCGTKTASGGRYCTRCGEFLVTSQLSGGFCPHCGEALSAAPGSGKCPVCQKKVGVTCLSCGRPCPPDSKFCQKCGQGSLDLRREPTGVLSCSRCNRPFSKVGRCPTDRIYLSGLSVRGLKIVKMLARGGMGAVYLTEKAGVKSAMKEMWPIGNGGSSPESDIAPLDLYLTEVEVMQALKEVPEVVNFVQAFMDEGSWILVMEFLEGKTLEDEFNERYPRDSEGRVLTDKARPYSVREVVATALKLAKIVRKVHDRGVVLRDLKPRNVMITPAGDYRFFDFGLSRWLSSKRPDFSIPVGTPGYIPPEGFVNPPVAPTPAFDVHALGAMIFQFLTGILPYDEGVVKFDEARRSYNWPFHEVRDLSLKDIVQKALETDPRYRVSVDQIIRALEYF